MVDGNGTSRYEVLVYGTWNPHPSRNSWIWHTVGKGRFTKPLIMKKSILPFALILAGGTAAAQFQINPQAGITYQQMTNPGLAGLEYRAAAGWQFGMDARIGDRIYFQPGAFIGRNATVVKQAYSDTLSFQDDLVRTNLKLRTMVGYRIVDTYQFDVRFAMGPSYDVLLGMHNRHDRAAFDRGDFRDGSLNWDAALGFDLGYMTIEPSASFGLSRVFTDAYTLKDLSTRFITYGLTVGINIGNNDQ
jgi:hypothetical protein